MSGIPTPKIGRPPGFDTEQALDRAMRVFWERGYEGASLSDLTEAMGINRSSMYAAFGNKEELFRLALQRYNEGPGGYVVTALEEPTAEKVARAFLDGSVDATTRADSPSGCLNVQGSLVAGDGGAGARDTLIDWREEIGARLEARFRQALVDGDLPADADIGLLSRYVVTVVAGIAVQATGGASREDLRAVADASLRNWPQLVAAPTPSPASAH